MKPQELLRSSKYIFSLLYLLCFLGSCDCRGPRQTHDLAELKKIIQEGVDGIFYKEKNQLRTADVLIDLNYKVESSLKKALTDLKRKVASTNSIDEKPLTDGVHKGSRVLYLKEKTTHMFFYLDPDQKVLGYTICKTDYPFLQSIIEKTTSFGTKEYFLDVNELDEIKSLYMDILMVHPDFRRKGVAKELLEAVEEKSKKLKKGSVVLYTWNKENQSGAYDFYYKNGFREICKDLKTVYMHKKIT